MLGVLCKQQLFGTITSKTDQMKDGKYTVKIHGC